MGFAIAGGIVASGVLANQGANAAASAAGEASGASQYQARVAYNRTKAIVDPATTAGLLAFDKDIANQERNLSRQEQLISQLDPTIIEASQQALKLLRGESSSTLGPIKAQRDQQRQKLLSSLREQLGPGAETSTAGMQALTKFDAETNSLLAGQQQSALQTLGGVSSQFSSQRPDMLREITGLSGFNQGKTQLQFQKAAALSNASLGLQQTAGAGSVAQLMQGQQQQALGNSLLSAGTTLGSAYLTKGAGTQGTAAGGTDINNLAPVSGGSNGYTLGGNFTY